MYGFDPSSVVENTLSGGSLPAIDMRLALLDPDALGAGPNRTAMPMFLTRDSRAASCGARLSMMVSCARLPGSAACSSLSKSVFEADKGKMM